MSPPFKFEIPSICHSVYFHFSIPIPVYTSISIYTYNICHHACTYATITRTQAEWIILSIIHCYSNARTKLLRHPSFRWSIINTIQIWIHIYHTVLFIWIISSLLLMASVHQYCARAVCASNALSIIERNTPVVCCVINRRIDSSAP